MGRNLLKNWLPDPKKVQSHKSLRWLSHVIADEHLWHLNRYSVSRAMAIGLFVAFLPVPLQMLVAAVLATIWHANMALSVVLVWISNPITIPLLFYGCYKLGAWILQRDANDFYFEWSYEWLTTQFGDYFIPMLIGCLIVGSVLSVVGYFSTRILWRYGAGKRWRARKAKRN